MPQRSRSVSLPPVSPRLVETGKAPRQVYAVYPSDRIRDVTVGLLLKPSAPPVPKTQALVSRHP